MKKYFDTHCHLNGEFYKDDIKLDISNAFEKGVDRILLPGTGQKDSLLAIDIANQYNNVYAAIGLHPCDAHTEDASDWIFDVDPSSYLAVGESGIDLYHVTSNPSLELQVANFKKHIELAVKHNKVLIVHAREAEEQVYEIVKQYPTLKFIMHCYTGRWEWAQKFLDLGAYISISGAVTYNKTEHINEVAKNTPLNRLIVETDAPFLTPVPHRGKYNKPQYVRYVARHVANLRDEANEEVIEALYNNSLKLFELD